MGSQVMGSNFSGRVLAGVLVLALAVAACGGGGEVDEVAEREFEGSNGTATVARDLDPVTTVAATTTTTEVVETTTTAATTSTTLAPTEEQQRVEIIAAVEAFAESWRECVRQLPNCDTAALSETRSSRELEVAVAQAERWNAMGYRAENIESMETRVEVVRFFDDSESVEVEACESDAGILLQGDEVIDDRFGSSRFYLQVFNDNGTWKVFQTENDQQAIGRENNLCA